MKPWRKNASGRLDDEAASNAARAYADAVHRAVFIHMAHLLQVGEPQPFGLIVRVADIVANLGGFSAEFTFPAHDHASFLSQSTLEYEGIQYFQMLIFFLEIAASRKEPSTTYPP
jgi:hypothetical protein